MPIGSDAQDVETKFDAGIDLLICRFVDVGETTGDAGNECTAMLWRQQIGGTMELCQLTVAEA